VTRPARLVVIGVCVLACAGRRSRSDAPDGAAADGSECGGKCDLTEVCVRGVCEKNPFMQGLRGVQEEPVEAQATCPYPPDEIPPADSFTASDIPEVDAKKARVIDLRNEKAKGGEERLSDSVLDEHLAGIHGRLIECIDLGACYTEEPLAGGEFSFRLTLAGSGKVTSVSVDLSPELRIAPIVACARRAVWETRFPRFDGAMNVTYEVAID